MLYFLLLDLIVVHREFIIEGLEVCLCSHLLSSIYLIEILYCGSLCNNYFKNSLKGGENFFRFRGDFSKMFFLVVKKISQSLISSFDDGEKGYLPDIKKQSTIPKDHTSALIVYCYPYKISGAIQSGISILLLIEELRVSKWPRSYSFAFYSISKSMVSRRISL